MKSWRDASAAEQFRIARAWLAEFGETLRHRDYARTALMIHPEGYWRDLLTFGWIFKTLHGIEEVEAWLTETFDANRAYDFCLEGEPQIGAFGDHTVTLQFFFKFETEMALGRGFVRLVESPNAPNDVKAFTILTAMSALKAFPEATGRKRPRADLRSTSNNQKIGLTVET